MPMLYDEAEGSYTSRLVIGGVVDDACVRICKMDKAYSDTLGEWQGSLTVRIYGEDPRSIAKRMLPHVQALQKELEESEPRLPPSNLEMLARVAVEPEPDPEQVPAFVKRIARLAALDLNNWLFRKVGYLSEGGDDEPGT